MTQTAQISETKSGRIPGLDGLRAIAIILIVLGHLWQQDFWYGNCPIPQLPIPGGALSIFFVLCGFCAGYYSSKTTDAKTYYKKKAKRLFPAYYTYIAIAIITYLLLGRAEEVLNIKLLYYIVPAGIIPFCQAQGILPLVHLWFLSPIVIAYLLFPALLKAFMGGSRIRSLSILCFAFAILKWTLYLTAGKDTFAYRFFSASQFDCIFGGLLLGLLLKNSDNKVPRIFESKITNWILWAAFLTSGFYQHLIPAPVRNEFFGLLAAFLIIGMFGEGAQFKFKAPIWGKLSKASYYIYVYHILAIILISEAIGLFT